MFQRVGQTGDPNQHRKPLEAASRNRRIDNVRWLGRRQQHRVDDMYDAIAGYDVGLHHLGIVDVDLAVHHLDPDRIAFHRLRAAECDHLRGFHAPRHNMVSQNVDQLLLVLWHEQHIQSARGQLGKRRIGRRKHRKWALTAEGLH
jgi:hypothetical protein